ncbi:MAG TPA: cupin domain-containing protein [Geminicoccaceae bacterium]
MTYPTFFHRMPLADLPVTTAEARMVASDDALVIFFDFKEETVIPPHAHGAQWGVVIEGSFELTVGGETRTVGPGDTYDIPPGVEHSARVPAGVRLIDVFEEAGRYKPRAGPGGS